MAASKAPVFLSRAYFRLAFNEEPSMAISGIAALIFMSLPFVVVPLRKKAGFATHQWDSDPATSHVRILLFAAGGP